MRRSARYSLCTLLCMLPFLTWSQESTWPAHYFAGYSGSIRGGNFEYHSPQPGVKTSLLLRSIDSAQYIQWETGMIPGDFSGHSASFIWMFGIDANPDSHEFRLYFNGHYLLSFNNPVALDMKGWKITGKEGQSLDFRTTMLDKYDDPMGYAILTVPASFLEKGKPQMIRVSGESAGSRSWYMTFEAPVEEKAFFVQQEAVMRVAGKENFCGSINIIHLGGPAHCKITIPGIPDKTVALATGYNSIPEYFPVTKDTSRYIANIAVEGRPVVTLPVVVAPVRQWTIYLVEHTHTDIGYTRPQTEILPEHLRYIDYALDYCDQTDSLPDDARFRWTCETSWAVREYLETRPKAQTERLKQRVKEGRIEITGLFLNSSDLADEASVAASLRPIGLFRANGMPVTAAMQDDINGAPWCLADYLSGCGVDYLSMGQNASRALKPFDRPTTFWWVSPSGNRIMVNRPEHYMWANQLGILTNGTTFGNALFQHLQEIGSAGYPFDRYAIHFSGYLTDNSPPSTRACGLVKEWNETYVWPRLRLATVSEFMKYMKMNHSEDLTVLRGAWPDWWMDGFGSAALETAYARAAHEDYIADDALMSVAVMKGIPIPGAVRELQDEISDDISFYDEHTFGAAESITDPLAENSVVQWGEKASWAWEAVKKNHILREQVMGLIQSSLPRAEVPTLSVINTLNWERSGIAVMYVDHQVIPAGKKFTIVDDRGNVIPAQAVSSREDGTYWALSVTGVPPLGYRSYRILATSEHVSPGMQEAFTGTLENAWYRLAMDPGTGTITGITDKRSGIELVDTTHPYSFGQFIYETLGKNRGQLEQLQLNEYSRKVWTDLKVSGISKGPVWESIVVKGVLPGCCDVDGITCEIRLYNDAPKMEFLFSMKKLAVTDPEGVYVAFPFAMNDFTFNEEVSGGIIVPGKDQLPGSSSDWQGVQNFVSLKNKSRQVVFVSPEIPLVQLGEINLGRFARIADPKAPAIYSWVLNNYWTTNFRAYQEGELKWRYVITSSADTGTAFATKFGWGERMPFLSRVFPAASGVSGKPSHSFLGSSFDGFLMVSCRPSGDGSGLLLHLREITGEPKSIPVDEILASTGAKGVQTTDVLGEMPVNASGGLSFKPWETKFIKLNY
jgi:alpha-mannosidase